MSLGELMELGAVQEAVDAVISERALDSGALSANSSAKSAGRPLSHSAF
jgi:hypothetical protein